MIDPNFDSTVWEHAWYGCDGWLPATLDDVKMQLEALPRLICGCGAIFTDGRPDGCEAAVALLRDLLDVFEPGVVSETHPGYLDLDRYKTFVAKHGYAVYHLVFNLLQRLGFCEHSGSVSSSASLTEAGGGLKHCLNMPGFVERAYR